MRRPRHRLACVFPPPAPLTPVLRCSSNDRATLATNGFAADAEALVQLVRARLELYRSAHGASMPLAGVARMLCTILYGKRFFPYYVWNVLGGLDEEGKGAVYTFDPVGSYEREVCRAAGAAQSLLQPFLDSQVMYKNQQATPERPLPIPGHISLRHAISIATDSFTSATERHIEVGDGLEIFVVRDPKAKTQTKEDEPMAAAAAGAALVDVPPPAGQLDLLAAPFNAAEAQGGEDDQSPGATLVIRRELKKD